MTAIAYDAESFIKDDLDIQICNMSAFFSLYRTLKTMYFTIIL